MALSLEEQLFYQQGDRVEDIDMIKGRALDLWIAEIVGNNTLPEERTVTVVS